MRKDLRPELAKALDDWFESEDGKQCLSFGILSSPGNTRFLKNRLEGAFLAGVKYAETQSRNGRKKK